MSSLEMRRRAFLFLFATAGCNCGQTVLIKCPSACPTGTVCRDGTCVSGCYVDSDCAGGEVCVGGVCSKACVADGDCGGAACVNNYCAPPPDAGSPAKDAGTSASHDSGTPGVDAGGPSPVDAGSPPSDGGTGRDAGTTPQDSGVTLPDAGSCPASATLVYVIDANGTLSSFTPAPTPTFTDLGKLNCPAASGLTPYSMSVDRNPVAWVLYASANSSTSQMFKVDIPTLSCTNTGWVSGQHGFSEFGMGFVSDGPGTNHDTLFIANGDPNNLGLGSLDTSTLLVKSIGWIRAAPELTGTADGRLYAYIPGNSDPMNLVPPAIVEYDKTNANEGNGWPFLTLEDMPCQDPSGQCTIDYAFAFWGGDFWIFLKLSNDPSTRVWRFNPTTQALDNVIDNTGRNIVGAGVSTCAPIN